MYRRTNVRAFTHTFNLLLTYMYVRADTFTLYANTDALMHPSPKIAALLKGQMHAPWKRFAIGFDPAQDLEHT
jgi:hypothetical protein